MRRAPGTVSPDVRQKLNGMMEGWSWLEVAADRGRPDVASTSKGATTTMSRLGATFTSGTFWFSLSREPAMPDHRPLIRRFFTAYAQRMNDALKRDPTIDTVGVV